MKKWKKHLLLWAWLAVFLIVPAGNVPVQAGMDVRTSDCVREGEWEYYIKEDGTAEIRFHWGNTKDIVIPSELGGRVVTSIGECAFDDHRKTRSITLPDTITSIGDGAFWACESLNSITLPDGLMSIGEDAFNNCFSLVSVTIPESVEHIGKLAFDDCHSLRSITLPKRLKTIEEWTFYNCYSLSEITIPENVTTIGELAFARCRSLSKITIPENVTTICKDAFSGCGSLSSIRIPKNVINIGEAAFVECSSLKEIIVDEENMVYTSKDGVVYNKAGNKILICPATRKGTFDIASDVTGIGAYAFYGCEISDVTIPKSVTSIETAAFLSCKELKSVAILGNVTTISESAFADCWDLINITIPKSVTSVKKWAFFNCDSLNNIYYTGSKKNWKKMKIASKNKDLKNATVHYNSGMVIKPFQYSFTYNGKARRPKVTVMDTNGQKIDPSMYKVTYKNNKNVGQASIIVTGKKKDIGTQTVHFMIYPQGTKIMKSSVTQSTANLSTVSLKWKKQMKQTDGYQIWHDDYPDLEDISGYTVTIKNSGTTSHKIKEYWITDEYYLRIRTYKNVKINGKKKKIYSDWSDVKVVKVEK